MSDFTTAVEKADDQREVQRQTVAQFIGGLGTEIQRSLPKHLNGDRMVRIATTLIRQSDMSKAKGISKQSLSECTPQSFAACLFTASALGLEPGVNGQAWLIPYWDSKAQQVECQIQVGYQGMTELAYRHPLVRSIRSGFIRFDDPEVDPPIGSLAYVAAIARHRLGHKIDKKEVVLVGYWALVELTTGGEILEVLSADEVRDLRGKVGPNGGIADPQHWMERKTVLKQALKSAPRSVEAYWAHQIDEESGTRLHAEQIPQQISEQVAIEASEEPEPDGPNIQAPPPAGADPWEQK